MPHRHCPRITAVAARAILALGLLAVLPATAATQAAPAYGIDVHAAGRLAAGATSRLLVDLSCESAMSCWGEPDAMTLIDATTGETVASSPGELLYVDSGGNVLADPPMQGTIRAIWAAAIAAPPAPAKLQLAVDGVAATAAFEPAAECAALPAGAVKRLSGG
jgi:hypothetical protein